MDAGSRRLAQRMAMVSGLVTACGGAMAVAGAFTSGTTRVGLIGAGIALGVGASLFGGVQIGLVMRAGGGATAREADPTGAPSAETSRRSPR
jgi:hypothetical protein